MSQKVLVLFCCAATWGLTLSPPSLSQPVQITETVPIIATPELLSIDTVSRYGDYVDGILKAFNVGQMTKAEAMGKLESADRYLTRPEMTARLYPPGGLREQVTRTFGYVYSIDRKAAEGDTPTNFKNASQYSDRLDMITDSYQSGKITKTEALSMISDANTHATKGLEQQLFPPQGTREKMSRIFGYLYETTDPNEKIKNMLPEAAMWPERVSANLLFGWGKTALLEKRNLAAYEWFTMTLRNDPNFVEAYLERGNTRLNTKDYEGAIKDYTQAIALKPDYRDAYLNRGATLIQIGQKVKGNQDLKHGNALLPPKIVAPNSH
jgi:tetratricopeptide (TPR) repeat protein